MRKGLEDRNRRREAAEVRAEARANRTTLQQLKRLDEILGEGVGAEKERAHLEKQLRKQ
jgi:hypothetical protein